MANLRAKDFDFGAPKVMAFKAAGQNVDGQYGTQVRFSTTAGDSLYLDPDPANDIETSMRSLGIAYGEEFRLARAKTSHGGSRFVIERIAGRDAGGHNVPARSDAYEEPVQRSAAPVATVAAQSITATSMKFCAAMMTMVDAMRETKTYALRCGLDLTTEDLRAMVISAYITDCKGGR
jgi:hypothetical protein